MFSFEVPLILITLNLFKLNACFLHQKLVDQGFNSEQEAPRNATLIELTHTCDDAESFFGTLNPVSQTLAEEVIDHIAILVSVHCDFLKQAN